MTAYPEVRRRVLALPRVVAARLHPDDAQRLGDAVETAAQRLAGLHWRYRPGRGRPPQLALAAVTRDVADTLRALGFSAGWWRDKTTGHEALIVEVMKQIVGPSRTDWRRVIRIGQEMRAVPAVQDFLPASNFSH